MKTKTTDEFLVKKGTIDYASRFIWGARTRYNKKKREKMMKKK